MSLPLNLMNNSTKSVRTLHRVRCKSATPSLETDNNASKRLYWEYQETPLLKNSPLKNVFFFSLSYLQILRARFKSDENREIEHKEDVY